MADTLTPELCVIGAGAAGLAVAEAARSLGVSVLVVDRGPTGGRFLHNGAIPAMALSTAAAHAHTMRNGASFGVTADAIKVNFRRVHEHVDAVISAVSPSRSVARYEALGAQLLTGEAAFVDRRTLQVGETLVKAHRFVVATGSRPIIPAIPGLEAVPYFTTDTILDNTRKLTHLLVIGGTGLGLQLAQSYARLGAEVTVIEPGAFLPDLDPELTAVALRRLEEEGVHLRSDTSVTAILPRSMGIGVSIHGTSGEAILDVSHILVAVGRTADLDALSLNKAGVKRRKDDAARPQLNPSLRTTNPRIYVVGDATGAAGSVASALDQARLAVDNALLGISARNGADRCPRVVHTYPAIAEVGLSEKAARARHGTGFEVLRAGFGDNDKARADRDTAGVAKLIVTRSGRVIGASVVGAGAGELIALFSLVLANGMNVRQLAEFSTPYPGLAQVVTGLVRQPRAMDDPMTRMRLRLTRLLG